MLVEVKKLAKKEVAVVTSLDIAETFDKEHARVLRDIRELNCSPEFRIGNFAESIYFNEQNHKQPMYYVTRDGFTLLAMGYTGEKSMRFKEWYIRQFNEMEKELEGKHIEREKGIVIRQAYTKQIKDSGEDERMHGHAYSTYTNVIYKAIFGKDAKDLRKQMGLEKQEDLRDCFTKEELQAVEYAEFTASNLMHYGWGYQQIKDFLENNINVRIGIEDTSPEDRAIEKHPDLEE